MLNQFLCPKCRGFLNVRENIVFSAKRNSGEKGLVLLHPQLGNYQVVHHPDFYYEPGEKLDFFCSICHAKLTSRKHENLAKVLMINHEDKKEYEIIFSRLAGEKCTYKVLADLLETFGEDSDNYMKYFFLSQIK